MFDNFKKAFGYTVGIYAGVSTILLVSSIINSNVKTNMSNEEKDDKNTEENEES